VTVAAGRLDLRDVCIVHTVFDGSGVGFGVGFGFDAAGSGVGFDASGVAGRLDLRDVCIVHSASLPVLMGVFIV